MSTKIITPRKSRSPLSRKSTMDETIREGLNFLNSGCKSYWLNNNDSDDESTFSTSDSIKSVLGKRSLLLPRTRSKSPSSKKSKKSIDDSDDSDEEEIPRKKVPRKSKSPVKKSSPPKKSSPKSSSPRKSSSPKSTPVKRTSRASTPIHSSYNENELKNLRIERKMKSTGIDSDRLTEIIFSFDTTGSMGSAIAEAKKNIVEITTRLFDSVSNLRIGLIAHGDYCDPKPTIFQSFDLSSSKDDIISWVNSVQNGGGGDTPENYEQVLEYAAHNANWTPGSHRVLVVIGDSYPHPPEECLSQMKQYSLLNPRAIDWKFETDQCWENGIKIYGVRANCTSPSKDLVGYFYESLAARTCGTSLQLSNFPMLTDMLLMVCFREADRMAFDNFRDEVEREGRMDDSRKEMFDRVAA